MKASFVFLLIICTNVLSSPVKKEGVQKDKAFLEKQKHVLQLLYHVNQSPQIEEYKEIAKTYSIEEHKTDYTKTEVVTDFLKYLRYDAFLPKGDIFSIMFDQHILQAIVLTKLFYYAKNWDTFLKTAVWAREHMNERLFVYAFSVAILHRPDTKGIILPAIYEITPHFFFNQEVMNKANFYKEIFDGRIINAPHTDPLLTGFTINSNYSGWYLNLHPEQSMSYYLEDIELSSRYYYTSLLLPVWMNAEEFQFESQHRGLIYIIHTQQLLARWNLERLSNGFGEDAEVDLDSPLELFYNPSLVYPNGLPFPSRPAFADFRQGFVNYKQKWSQTRYSYSLSFVKDYGRRIGDVCSSGFAVAENSSIVELKNEEGLNMLGNMIECNNNSIFADFYGPIEPFARYLLGCSYLPLNGNKLIPSVLEHYETTLRDPVIYQWMKNIVNWSQRFVYGLEPYTREELLVPGVEITEVKMDPLITYMDYFYSDLTNAVWYHENEKPGDFRIRVRQLRMNHKPFSYTLTVKSDEDQKVVVRTFIGPKYDEYGRKINIKEHRLNFVAIDFSTHDLKAGDNIITRNSHEFSHFTSERLPYWRIWRMLNDAMNGTGEFNIPQQNSLYWPQRTMLPKGSVDGKAYQFLFFIDEYVEKGKSHPEEDYLKNIPKDEVRFMYPLNRIIKFENLMESLPNARFHEEKIYFKDVYDLKLPRV